GRDPRDHPLPERERVGLNPGRQGYLERPLRRITQRNERVRVRRSRDVERRRLAVDLERDRSLATQHHAYFLGRVVESDARLPVTRCGVLEAELPVALEREGVLRLVGRVAVGVGTRGVLLVTGEVHDLAEAQVGLRGGGAGLGRR